MAKQIYEVYTNLADYTEFDHHPFIEIELSNEAIGELRRVQKIVIKNNFTFINLLLSHVPGLFFTAIDENENGDFVANSAKYHEFLDNPHVVVSRLGWRIVTYNKYAEGEFSHDIIPIIVT